MKKITFFIVAVFLVLGLFGASMASAKNGVSQSAGQVSVTANQSQSASGSQSQKPADQEENNEEGQVVNQQTQNEGQESQIRVQQEVQEKIKTVEQLRQQVQERAQEMEQEMVNYKEEAQNVLKNQNPVRLAVHSLLAMEDMVGGIGQQVSEIAKEFNNSIQSTLAAEEKIESRGFMAKLFFGGDREAANQLQEEAQKNMERIRELVQLQSQVQLKQEVKNQLQEEIQTLQQEQVRLQSLVQNELSQSGVFGWLVNLFK